MLRHRWRTCRRAARSRGIDGRLHASLERFAGYADRFAAALAQVDRGQRQVRSTNPALDSAHTVWFQLHEDLLATLNLARGCE